MSINKMTPTSVSSYQIPTTPLENYQNSISLSLIGMDPSIDSQSIQSNHKPDPSNEQYMGFMRVRGKLIQTAKKVNETTISFPLVDVEAWRKKALTRSARNLIRECPNPKIIRQREYSVLTADGEMRYFFVNPERVICQQEYDMYNVHMHFTSMGKPIVVPEDYLTNPVYRKPSPIPDETSELVTPVDNSPSLVDSSKLVKREDVSLSLPVYIHTVARSENVPPLPIDSSKLVKPITSSPLPVYIHKVIKTEDVLVPLIDNSKSVKRKNASLQDDYSVGCNKFICIVL